MKPFKLIFLALTLLSVDFALGQDTTFVQTLTFDSINTRRGFWTFPDDGTTYRKILMYYKLKCDPATTVDSYDCGEWDYSTTNEIIEHTGVYDSVRVNHPKYLFGGQNIDTINFVTIPYYNYFQSEQYDLNISSTVSEQEFSLGLASGQTNDELFGASSDQSITQMLWTSQELSDAGLQAGAIHKLRFNFSLADASQDLNNLTISMKHTDLDSLVTFDNQDDFQEVYYQNTSVSSGVQTFNLYDGFVWDGVSNILMEVSFLNLNNYNSNNQVLSSTTPMSQTVYTTNRDGYLEITSGERVEVALDNVDFSNEVTVSFWAQGNEDVLPLNTSIFEGFDSNNTRRLNVHFPWSDNRIYWDAGINWGSQSRIDNDVQNNEITNQWNHWAFTKDAVSGKMEIYKNGQLWHSGTGKHDSISVVNTFRIAQRSSWDGKIDEFRVWKKYLSQEEINSWRNVTVDNTHPHYQDLVLYYDFNNSSFILDQSPNEFNGAPSNEDMIKFHNSSDQFLNIQSSTNRPNITFVQGQYTSTVDTAIVTDSIMVNPVSLAEYESMDGYFNIANLSYLYPEGWSYTFDHNGLAIDSNQFVADNILLNDTVHYYNDPYEIVNRYEIGRYITPYGLGLDLGDGFTWVYDITDYAHLLKGEVDINSPNRSELVDLKFALIHGTPARKVRKVSDVWSLSQFGSVWGSYTYFNLDNDNSLSNTQLFLDDETEYIKLKTIITGHGHNSSNGEFPHCCEWKDNTHYLFANGNQIADWHIWQTNDCALNPVFPQGGTWLGAREGWCPGDVVKGREFELTQYIQPDNSISLDYDITPVPANNPGMGSGRYDMTMHLIQYEEANFELDVEIYDVISPNNWEYVSRKNPICNGIEFVIRNGGTETLNSAKITYKVSGGEAEVFEWTGSLKFMESEVVKINVDDASFWLGDGSGKFIITASNPNNSQDENEENNTFISNYEEPIIYSDRVALRYKTNNFPQDNSVTVTDLYGDVVYSNTNLSANTLYFDTLDLSNGCYSLKVLDTGNDGLDYWAWQGQDGSGFFQIRPIPGPITTFESEFGREINYSFVIGSFTNIEQPKTHQLFVYPNPTTDIAYIESNELIEEIKVYDISGRLIIAKQVGDYFYKVDLSLFENGVYYIDVFGNDKRTREKLIKQ
ncbi:MAG: T9SS type A sorting domain-containing protein [Flavobacteriales bacterium]